MRHYGKTPSPSRKKAKAPPPRGGAHHEHYLANTHTASPNRFTYARMHAFSYSPLPPFGYGWPWVPSCGLGDAVVALCGRARRGWSCAGPRRRRPSSASVPILGGPPTLGGTWPPPWTGLPTPLMSNAAYVPRSGKDLEALEAPPRQCLRPALRVEAPRVPVQAFGPGRRDVALRDTTGHLRYPDGSRVGLAYSPGLPRWHDRLFLRALRVSPYGQHDETALRFRRSTPSAIIRGPHPVRRLTPSGSPVSLLLLECPRL